MFNNCKECHAFGRVNRLGLCRTCNDVDENLMSLMKEIINTEGKMTVFAMAERIGISANRIFRYIEESRLKSHLFKHACPFCSADLIEGKCKCPTFQLVGEPLPAKKHPEKFHSAIRVEKRKQEYWDRKSNINRRQKRDIWIRS